MRIFDSVFMTEFELIASLASRFPVPDGIQGIGDDCAVIPDSSVMPGSTGHPTGSSVMPDLIGHPTDLLVTTDLLAEGVHFLLDRISPEDLGWKSAAVNISDIAAMGGLPKYAFLSLALPKDLTAESPWLDAFFDGFAAACRQFGVALLGGDTSASASGVFINVTLIGNCPHGTALLRSAAKPGDLICVTGTLGDSAAGLKVMKEGDSSTPLRFGRNDSEIADEEYVLRKHCRPEPRVAEGLALRDCPGVHAMMDISDGVAADLPHILEASGVGATVDVASLPLSPELRRLCASRGWDAADLALCGGEDYELLFTMAPGTVPPISHTVIGTIDATPGLRWLGGQGSYSGFRHF